MKDVASERANEVGTPSTLLELPHPDGSLALFRVIESPVMAPELAAKFPEIRTFRGEGIDDPTASVRFELSPRGFSAMVLSAFGAWYVEPWSRENRDYVASFHRRDALRDPDVDGPRGEQFHHHQVLGGAGAKFELWRKLEKCGPLDYEIFEGQCPKGNIDTDATGRGDE